MPLSNALGPIKEGSVISVDLEEMYVWAISEVSQTATVERGYLGSTAAAHTTLSIVYANSKFSAFSIFQALNADLMDLCSPASGLYRVVSLEVTYNPAIQGYDFTGATNVSNVLRVKYDTPGSSKTWVDLNPGSGYVFKRDASAGDFASGFSLTLRQDAWAGQSVRLTYATDFSPFTTLATTTTTVGLPDSAVDLPPLGAGMRLAGVREVQRNFNESQGDTRRASEVPPNSQMAGMQALMRLRTMRVQAESAKLSSDYPPRRNT